MTQPQVFGIPGEEPAFGHFIAQNRHGTYCVPEDYAHREVPTILAAGEVYETDTLDFLARLYPGGDIVSGGAFVGDFLPFLSRLVAADSRVISFEPHPISWHAAQRTLRLNELTNVDIAPVAVGARAETLPLRVAKPNGRPLAAAARLVPGAENTDGMVNVDVVRLDDMLDGGRWVSILHLDVEGHEEAALRGAQGLLQRCRPFVVLEAAAPKRQAQRIDGYLAILRELAPEAGYDKQDIIASDGNVVFAPGLAPE
ncbi:FkbM family methyltransferase [Marinibacterium sp. SX1]|uniref:FkbM family methyltransferase n=1 Tax=Marinibacterium sp. SX1 TaxID=3388424 RepID=UPI003D172C0A